MIHQSIRGERRMKATNAHPHGAVTLSPQPASVLAGIGQQWLEVERAMGIEPTAQAWEAWVLPLYDARYATEFNRDLKGRQIAAKTG
jgi:hypothetical protein